MKNIYLILLLTLLSCNKTQKTELTKEVKVIEETKNNWQEFRNEKTTNFQITKTQIVKREDLKFNAIWDNKLSHSDNIGYYGGIKQLTIYKNNKIINQFKNIEDGIALGNIRFELYDFNLDGYIDFRIPINCGAVCWKSYYLFNPKTNKFEHRKDWDYLRIRAINKETKQIRNQPYGNSAVKTYQIDGLNLIQKK